MNHSTFNATISTCGNSLYRVNLENISPDLRAVSIFRIVPNAFTCPITIVLNILLIVSVKTKRQLRTKSNVALACLSTTDLFVGLVLQPLHIASASLLHRGDTMFCIVTRISTIITSICGLASLHHIVLVSTERYFAIKHPFKHETQVTEVRIVVASALAWAAAIIVYIVGVPYAAIVIVCEALLIIFPIYCNVSVYKEIRRNEKQIAANQVSLETKGKLLKKRKAFYTTIIVLLAILLCYIPSSICSAILVSFKERIPPEIMTAGLYASSLVTVLNSLFNPLIYAFRIRYFRVAFIQLLGRKTISQAEELEKKIFGPRQTRVNGDTGQGNHTLSEEHEPSRQTEQGVVFFQGCG